MSSRRHDLERGGRRLSDRPLVLTFDFSPDPPEIQHSLMWTRDGAQSPQCTHGAAAWCALPRFIALARTQGHCASFLLLRKPLRLLERSRRIKQGLQ